jgi:hypothetical protein
VQQQQQALLVPVFNAAVVDMRKGGMCDSHHVQGSQPLCCCQQLWQQCWAFSTALQLIAFSDCISCMRSSGCSTWQWCTLCMMMAYAVMCTSSANS